MTQIPRLTPELRTDLVAYLDGELDADRTQEIEAALASSPVVRREVELLTRTWEMLDLVPQETASEGFAEETMTSIKIEEQKGSSGDGELTRKVSTWLRYGLYAVVLTATGALAFMTTYRWIPRESDRLLQDYPVIERLDDYSQVESVDYLKRLESRRPFREVVPPNQSTAPEASPQEGPQP